MRASGLVDAWTQWYQPDCHQCLDEANKIQGRSSFPTASEKPTISLKNLTSAFTVLIAGYLCSLLAFLVEMLVSCKEFKDKKIRNPVP